MTFLKLTKAYGRDNDKTVYLDVNKIVSFSEDLNEKNTYISLQNNSFLYVKETPEQILQMIGASRV